MPKKRKAAELAIWTHSEEIIWYSVRDKLPDYVSGQRGTQVLIWPPYVESGCADMRVACFGDWVSPRPWFYMFGAMLDGRVENWAYLPKGPAPMATSAHAKKSSKRPKRKETA